MRQVFNFILFFNLPLFPLRVLAADVSTDQAELRAELTELKHLEQEMKSRMQALEERLNRAQGVRPKDEPADALEQALNEARKDKQLSEVSTQSPDSSSGVASTAMGQEKRPQDLLRVDLPKGASARLIDIALIPQIAMGGSTADDETLESLQGGGHDPNKRGFTLQQAELSIGGAIDPFFYGEGHFVFLEGEGVETEEVFLSTTSLPYNLELEIGQFYTEFGLINPSHPHAWDYVDQPVVNTRMFGGDGMRNPGIRVSKLLNLPWTSEFHLGMQQSTGEYMASFRGGEIQHNHGESSGHQHERRAREEIGHEEHEHDEHEEHHEEHAEEGHEEEHGEEQEGPELDGIGGFALQEFDTNSFDDFVYLARLDNYLDLSEETGLKLGFSGLYGPNSTGEDGETFIYGSDFLVKWTPKENFRGYPYIKLQSEVIGRSYRADDVRDSDGENLLSGDTIHDWGFYSQLLYGFHQGWAIGARAEYASGSGEGSLERDLDPFRSDRLRLSPILSYRPTEFSRIRLQYNYDDADYLEDEEHSVWLAFDAVIGSHPAHRYGQN